MVECTALTRNHQFCCSNDGGDLVDSKALVAPMVILLDVADGKTGIRYYRPGRQLTIHLDVRTENSQNSES